MPIINKKLSAEEFAKLTRGANMVKIVVDVKKEILSFDCALHIDCAEELMDHGSENKNLWGANVYPQKHQMDFSAVFNIRPASNRSMEIQNAGTKKAVEEIIKKLLPI